MARILDFIIFGASGYTGRFVVKEMCRIGKDYPNIRWAIAGRSRSKLQRVLQEAAESHDKLSIEIITADVEDEVSLRRMCLQCSVVVNCCGPYVYTGEPVVRAAVECGTHYIDVCSELQFLDKVLKKYDTAAREQGVYVINACGLGCIPADLGLVFLQQQFQGTLHSVDAYVMTQVNIKKSWLTNVMMQSTWEGMIEGLAAKPLLNSSKQGDKEEPKLKKGYFHKKGNRWSTPFPGAEESVVERTQKLSHSPIQFKRYQFYRSIYFAIIYNIFGLFIFIMSKVLPKSLLFKYSRLFSFGLVARGDPDEKIMKELTYEYEMYGVGWKGEVKGRPEDKIVARIHAEGENAPYEGTAVAVIYAAITLLTEREKMPTTYGVLTPGVAFKNTSIIEKYNKDKLKFEIIDK